MSAGAESVLPADAGQPASLWRRCAAIGYDLILLAAVQAVYAGVVIAARGGRAIEPHTPWFSSSLLIVAFLFFGWFWTHGGQTLGMLAWRIKLRTTDGRPVRWQHAAVRYAAGCVSAAAGGLGFWWSLIDPQRRAWHDIVSGTRLEYTPKPRD